VRIPQQLRPPWGSSARLQITLGIIVSLVISQVVILVAGNQFMWSSTHRATEQRMDHELADFADYARSPRATDTGEAAPTPAGVLRAYLSMQYPDEEVLLVGTDPATGGQLTLSRTGAADDPLFPPDVRVRLLEAARGDETSGRIDADVDWKTARADSPVGPVRLLVAVNDLSERRETEHTIRTLQVLRLAGLAAIAIVAWLLAGWMLAPIRRIREAADTISVNDLSRRVPTGGPDEIAALSETVNSMLDRVEKAYRTQREFLDDAGHELRTPLTVVQANLDLLPDDPDERAESTRIIQDELDRMTRIVEDLLTLARADRPDFLRPTTEEVSDLVLDVEAKIEVVADREWIVRPEADGVAVVDRHRITQALLQFCANAVRFTGPGDRIEIGCRVREPGQPTVDADRVAGPVPPEPAGERTESRLLWWVRDSGPGIPEGEEADIFQRFHTARGQLRDGRGGTGLGLAIVASIASAHGGRAFAVNAEGGGAVFCIVIPLVCPDDAPPWGSADEEWPPEGD